MPHELVARYLIPGIRALVAHALRRQGLGQERIARLLGVSQPLVSRYLRRRFDDILQELGEIGVDIDEVRSIVSILAARLILQNYTGYMELFTSYINTLLARGALCSFHRRLDPRLPVTCNICMNLFKPGRDPYIEEVEEAAKLFASRPGVEKLVPYVGSNIVAAKPQAKTIAEVVGLTGAIVRVGDKVAIVGFPAYGGSKHTASILLLAYSKWSDCRAAVVIAFSEQCIEKLRRTGLRVIEAGPHESPEKLLEDIASVLEKQRDPVDVIADRGGINLEPVIYVFGRSAMDAVERALLCLGD
ncbi:putative transcriptional regulator - conserved protein [Hyperthermus butylicus DSM 5456]|uniref:Transcriptional regulator-conserved protein n=1 Tax=Hyperthermus butylicus (strain DSM 5456 / JCM 9403 / PLM1-5) TaxID=415426 RepID=A2BJ39_HYPBU|nr:putative transcriptional regulator - conserved protein [Hyperthermus butylicus DSM 5456]